jgi:hypothetical protein
MTRRVDGMHLDHALGQIDADANCNTSGFTSCNLLHGLPLSTLQIDDFEHHQSWRIVAVAGMWEVPSHSAQHRTRDPIQNPTPRRRDV